METTQITSRRNGIDLNILGGTVTAMKDDPGLGHARFRVSNSWADANHNVTSISGFYGARQELSHKQVFEIHADEPPILAGGDEAPNPVEIMLASLAACLVTSLVAHAAVSGIEVRKVETEIEGDLDLNGFLGLDPTASKGFTDIRVTMRVDADTENVAKLRRLALFSPVYNTFTNGVNVSLDLGSQ